MKKYILIIITIALTSCGKDFLSVDPHDFTDVVYWKTADQAEAALAGAYRPPSGRRRPLVARNGVE